MQIPLLTRLFDTISLDVPTLYDSLKEIVPDINAARDFIENNNVTKKALAERICSNDFARSMNTISSMMDDLEETGDNFLYEIQKEPQ